MKTRYILHGGATIVDCTWNTKFYQEMVNGLEQPIKMLSIFHAIAMEDRVPRFDITKAAIANACPNKTIEFFLATDDVSQLKEKMAWADIIYLHGGNTNDLQSYLAQVEHLKDRFLGKTIVGTSAGAYVLSRYWYSSYESKVVKGLNILPIKTLAHWEESRQDRQEAMEKHGEQLPLKLIPETEFIVIEQ